MPPKPDEKPMDPKFEFWNKLPIDMQLECIKRMDFKSRMQLRGASKQDKLLVESVPKYHFDSVYVHFNQRNSSILALKSGEKVYCWIAIPPPNFFEQPQRLFINIFKFSTAKSLHFISNFETNDAVSKFLADVSQDAPFRFKNVYLNCKKLEIVKFWLRNCISAETICVHVPKPSKAAYGAGVVDILQFPSVINAKRLEFRGLNAKEYTYHFIKKWLDNDKLEAGQLIEFSDGEAQNLDFLAKKFENRVVSKTDKTLRIRTNDSAQHIFIRAVNRGNRVFYSTMFLIPFDQEMPE